MYTIIASFEFAIFVSDPSCPVNRSKITRFSRSFVSDGANYSKIVEFYLKVNVVSAAKCENAGFMFSCMFRRKRIQLIKRLLELRVRKEHEIRRKGEVAAMEDDSVETCGGGAGGSAAAGGAYYPLSDEGLLRNSVLKRLKDNQLEMLLEAVESGGGGVSTCVLIPKDAIPEPHALGCRFWRWPDVRTCAELRRMPACSSATDPIYMCCNPYHWSRLCQPGKWLFCFY